MGMHSSGWFSYLSYDENQDKPIITKDLLSRVWSFANPYRLRIIGLLLTILAISGISLISPLLYRDLIDIALPNRDVNRLNWLALGMILIPVVNGIIGVWQRQLNASIGEGVIYDLRRALYQRLQPW